MLKTIEARMTRTAEVEGFGEKYWWSITRADTGEELHVPIRHADAVHEARLTGRAVDVTIYPQPTRLCELLAACECASPGKPGEHIVEVPIRLRITEGA